MCDLMEPSEMVTVNGPPAPEHLLMVYLYVISKLSMTPDTVQVMVRVVVVGGGCSLGQGQLQGVQSAWAQLWWGQP